MGFDGPANLLEWILLASGLAAFVVMGLGLQKFFITPQRHERLAILFQESAIAVAVVHCVGIITRRSPGDVWTAGGIALYLLAIVLFLSAMESTNGVILPRAFADSEDQARLMMTGVYRFMRHPVYTAYSMAWLAAPVATQSPTLWVSALVMVILHVVAARRQDALLAARFGEEYRAYRRWWR